MLPLTDFVRPRRFPWVTVALAAACVLVWIAYQLGHGLDPSVRTLGFRPCEVAGTCRDVGLSWPLNMVTALFAHGGWSHLIGNLVFLLVFGPRAEDILGHVWFLTVYLATGVAALALDGGLTLAFASEHTSTIPCIGASGAISGVIAVYVLAYPFDRVLVWLIPSFFLRIPALALLGVWFVLQVLQGTFVLDHPGSAVGIAFMAHVGGFLAGALAFAAYWSRSRRRPLGSSLILRPH